MQLPYDAAFFANQRDGSLNAARLVLPLVLAAFPVRSAVDFGCGVGGWLHVLRELGVADIRGYDGDYVDRAALFIEPADFQAVDLCAPLRNDRRYDLAMSLEVAEHLPQAAAEGFVATLTQAAPIVLFSAAIPGQGGTDHVNERWQDEWRASFAARGYRPVDLIRPLIRDRAGVAFWYQQNIVIYCDADTLRGRPDVSPVPDDVSLNLVHPLLYESVRQAQAGLSKALRALPGLTVAYARRRLAGRGRSN